MKKRMFPTRMTAVFVMMAAVITGWAQSSITFTTNRALGSTLTITIGASGDVEFDGMSGEFESQKAVVYTVEKQTITIRGNIESMTCNGCGLTAIDLINAPELTTFKCDDNKLNVLDVRANTKLRTLYCQVNQLEELDVTSLADLRYLACSQNKLAELKLTNNPELRELYCVDNLLGELKVGHLSKLKKLSCSGNRLTELDVTANKSLGTLFCANNQLETLDVTQNAFLYQLAFADNEITSIDLSKNNDMETLFAQNNPLQKPLDVSGMKNLEQLYLFNTNSETVNLAENPKLKEFSCSHNRFRNLDISRNPELKMMWIQDNLMDTAAMRKLVEQLPLCDETKPATLIMKDVGVEDQNECRQTDVQKAKEKNWILYEIDGEQITPYDGVVDGIDLTYAQTMICRCENGMLTIEYARPKAAFFVYRLNGVMVGKGMTDAEGRAQMAVPMTEKQRLLVKVEQCGTVKL